MDQITLESMFQTGAMSSAEMVKQAPIDDLDEAVAMLKRYVSTDEICAALTERMKKAPIEDLQTLREVYLKHCVA
jgi:hypothetical protein